MIKYLTLDDNFDDLIKNNKVIVDFYADWCGPCRSLGMELEKMNLSDVTILKVNTDLFGDLARKYSVMSIPNLLFFQNGELKKSVVGLIKINEIEALINELFI